MGLKHGPNLGFKERGAKKPDANPERRRGAGPRGGRAPTRGRGLGETRGDPVTVEKQGKVEGTGTDGVPASSFIATLLRNK